MRFAHIFSVVLALTTSTLSAQIGTRNGALPPESESGRTRTQALPTEPDTYGTSAMSWKTFSAWDFHPMASTVTIQWTVYGSPASLGFYQTATGLMSAPLSLPEGALLSTLEFSACDSSPGGAIYFFLDQIPKTGTAAYTETPLGSTGATPGCTLFSFTLSPAVQIDNANNSYFLMVQFTATGNTLILNSARAGYKLQISPAPGTATFTDVPVGSTYHRFVEALVAAGITGGCGGGNYCPDAPVTRGQIAVFLSAALGLHWAP